MKIAGIVAEYNPFHTGHAYHLAQTRRILGEDTAVVAVMSGNWVQRGECAVADKWSRARAALAGGADLVLELPTPWAAASAEHFARGAMQLLVATGVVDTLSFGSECGDTGVLREIAQCLNSPEFSKSLKLELDPKRPFALNRRNAVARLLGEDAAKILDGPNNNLGAEYLRFLPNEIAALAIPRQGAEHDGTQAGDYASASLLRRWLRSGEAQRAAPYLPASWTGEAADLRWCERAILAGLRSMDPEEFQMLPDSGDGLAARLASAAKQAAGLDELYTLTKTRGYAHARVRRLVLYAFLGLHLNDRPASPPYLRVLGFGERGKVLLKEMSRRAALPLLVKPAHISDPNRPFSPQARSLFALETRCTDLFALCTPTPRPCGLEWVTNPVILD